ncbi:MAG: (2Fe-2S) ferredoxin domain-containing protein [Candidatus Moranbacteria bacterium]|nr:(2Fe-2S) ferredoxin domain-containing protein [Candidatus Moranbacteria bacterium]
MEVPAKKVRVRVCVHVDCCMRGSEKIYEKLSKDLGDTVDVGKTIDCFRFCKIGPNVSVNGTILHGVHLNDATSKVRREIDKPSRKIEGAGTKSIDELDDVLDGLFL